MKYVYLTIALFLIMYSTQSCTTIWVEYDLNPYTITLHGIAHAMRLIAQMGAIAFWIIALGIAYSH